MDEEKAAKIAQQNSSFREHTIKNLGGGPVEGSLVMTPGIRALAYEGGDARAPYELFTLLTLPYAEYPKGDNPYRQDDFAAFEFRGVMCFWKIDYFEDASLTYGCEDPSGPCYRVMTVMRADEY